jgi:rsbT co-antagonist protein RsbR
MATHDSRISTILGNDGQALLNDWVREQMSAPGVRTDLISDAEIRKQSEQFLGELREAVASGNESDITGPEWGGVRELLSNLSRTRATQGFTPTETATFVFSLKQPLFARLRDALRDDADALATETWAANQLIDRLGMFTTESFQKSREGVIQRQQQELLELSTPVVKLWDGILAVPLIGTLDSARTQVVMESLLERIVETGADFAIIDITGVPTVDTLVAQHLLKTVAAARLMGAECIISGIRPQIAQTIVHLGIEMRDIATKATLADAISLALRQTGWTVSRVRA